MARPIRGLIVPAATLIAMVLCGCSDPKHDVTFNLFEQNQGDRPLGKQVEGMADQFMEYVDHFDVRFENRVY